MKSYIMILSIFTILSFRVSSQEQNTQSTYWLGAGLGYGKLKSNSSHYTDNENLGFKLEAGYKYNNNFSVYGSYDYVDYSDSLDVFSTGLMGFESVANDILIFGKAGVSYFPGKSQSHGLSALIGAGLKLQLNGSTSGVIGYDFINDVSTNNLDSSENSLIYFGFNYEFNNSKASNIIEAKDLKPLNRPYDTYLLSENINSKEDEEDVGNYLVSFDQIYFNFDSTVIIDANPLIEYFSSLNLSAINHVSIYGHTDKIGPKKYNQNLSEERALSVLNILLNIGMPQSNISYYGLGSNFPSENQNATTNNALDRRVEILIEFNRID